MCSSDAARPFHLVRAVIQITYARMHRATYPRLATKAERRAAAIAGIPKRVTCPNKEGARFARAHAKVRRFHLAARSGRARCRRMHADAQRRARGFTNALAPERASRAWPLGRRRMRSRVVGVQQHMQIISTCLLKLHTDEPSIGRVRGRRRHRAQAQLLDRLGQRAGHGTAGRAAG